MKIKDISSLAFINQQDEIKINYNSKKSEDVDSLIQDEIFSVDHKIVNK